MAQYGNRDTWSIIISYSAIDWNQGTGWPCVWDFWTFCQTHKYKEIDWLLLMILDKVEKQNAELRNSNDSSSATSLKTTAAEICKKWGQTAITEMSSRGSWSCWAWRSDTDGTQQGMEVMAMEPKLGRDLWIVGRDQRASLLPLLPSYFLLYCW
jgi:hypothetical protein